VEEYIVFIYFIENYARDYVWADTCVSKDVNGFCSTLWMLGNIQRKKWRNKLSQSDTHPSCHEGPWLWHECRNIRPGTKIGSFLFALFYWDWESVISSPWLFCCFPLSLFSIFLSFVLMCMFIAENCEGVKMWI